MIFQEKLMGIKNVERQKNHDGIWEIILMIVLW